MATPSEATRRLAPVASTLPAGSRVLITGGSGFIGTNLVEALAAHSEVASIDWQPPRAAAQGPHWTELDILDRQRLHARVREFQPTIVLHAAARTDLLGRRIEDYETNTVGTESLLDALDRAGFRGMAVFFSSMLTNRRGATLSSLGQGDPDTHYGESKVLMEERVRAARPAYRYVVVRPTSIWGPWFAEPYRAFFQMVIQNRYFHPGAKTATKTFGYVSNTVFQVLTLAARDRSSAEPIYLGDDPPASIADWAREIASMAGVPPPRQLPGLAGRLAAWGGDAFQQIGIRLPLTTRRLNNMTQDHIVDLAPIMAVAPGLPFSRTEGTRLTLDWLRSRSG